jgi:hypothetical protein
MRNPTLRDSTTFWGILLSIFFISSMTPYLFNGFYADDCLNSQVGLVAQQNGQSVLDFALGVNRGWMLSVGRFFPLSWIVSFMYYGFFHTLPFARILHVLIVGSNIAFFCYLIHQWTGKKKLLLLFIPILISCFQMREPFDPISSYIPVMQSILFYILGAVYFQWGYLTDRKKWKLALSAAIFGCGLLTHEILVAFFPLLLIQTLLVLRSEKTLSKANQIKTGLISVVPHGLLLASYLAVLLYIRANRSFAYEGTEVHFVFKTTFLAFRNQLLAALPLRYWIHQLAAVRPMIIREFALRSPMAYLSAFSGMAIFYLGLRTQVHQQNEKKQNSNWIYLGLLSLALTFIPAIMISFSSRWQTWVQPGVGYLPVYLSYFGWAMMIAALAVQIARLSVVRIFLTGALGVILFIAHAANSYVAERMDQGYKYPRTLLTQAYAKGLIQGVKDKSIFVTPQSYQWNNSVLAPETVFKVKSVLTLSDFDQLKPEDQSASPLYFLNFHVPDFKKPNQGWAVFSEISALRSNSPLKNSEERYQVSHPRLYVQGRYSGPFSIEVQCLKNDQTHTSIFNSQVNLDNKESTLIEIPDFECRLGNIQVLSSLKSD